MLNNNFTHKILITGSQSYIGISFEKWLKQWPDKYSVDTADVRDEAWKTKSFQGYDAVFHVAGIAHVSSDPSKEGLYYTVNRDLSIEVANKAKNEGVCQFIFMSSIIIYGSDNAASDGKCIDLHTEPEPADFYGKSKLEADLAIQNMHDSHFGVTVIRSPVVYGPGCKGNFPMLLSIAKKAFLFPNIYNERSMIYIDNLCEFVRQTINESCFGICFPQNEEYVSTKNVVLTYREILGKKVLIVPFPKLLVKVFSRINMFNKAFGTKTYDKSISFPFEYQAVNFKESIYKIVEPEDE